MAVKLTPAGVFGKWVVAPGLLLLLGYFVVGPRIGKSIVTGLKSAAGAEKGPENADPPTAAPDVEVGVHKTDSDGTDPELTASPPKHKKHHKAASTQTASDDPVGNVKAAATNPPADDGGSAGSTTAG